MSPKPLGGASDGTQPPSPGETNSPSVEQSPEASADIVATSEGAATSTTKMSQATDIYRRMTRKKGTTRKEIIEVFIEKVRLTKSGAATYYQMIKKSRRAA